MADNVNAKQSMRCTFGSSISVFYPTHCIGVKSERLIANAMDMTPANIPPFGMCSSMMNPMVAAATNEAIGVLTPQPCNLVPVDQWFVPYQTVKVKNALVLTMDARLKCAYGGDIQFCNSKETL